MRSTDSFINLVLKALAMAMAVACVVLGILGASSVETLVTLLGIGLFALAIAALRDDRQTQASGSR